MTKYLAILLLAFSGAAFSADQNKPPTYEEIMGLQSKEEQQQEWKIEREALIQRAEQGEEGAQHDLGSMHYWGAGGAVQSYVIAHKWYKLSAEQGNSSAQSALGDLYNGGKGVIQDYEEAFKWFHLSAESGNAHSQYMLGYYYQNGFGITQDNVKAHMWFNISGSLGNKDGSAARDTLEKQKLSSTEVNKAQKLARECMAKNYKDC